MKKFFLFLIILPSILYGQNVNNIPPKDDYSKIYGKVCKIEKYTYSAVINNGKVDINETLKNAPTEFREYDYDHLGRLIKDAQYNNQYQLVQYYQWIYSSNALMYHIQRNWYGTARYRSENKNDCYKLSEIVNGNSQANNEEDIKFNYSNGKLKEIKSHSQTAVLDYFNDGYIATISHYNNDNLYKVITQRFDTKGQIVDETINVNDRRLLTKFLKYDYDSFGNWVSRLYKTIFDGKELYYYEYRMITYL